MLCQPQNHDYLDWIDFTCGYTHARSHCKFNRPDIEISP